jgi:hypothetical protein
VTGETLPTIQLEAMLLDWSETAKGGAKLVLQLPSADDLDAFRAFTLAKRGHAGQRFMAVFVPIGDDEKPEPVPSVPDAPGKPADPPAHALGGPLARLAGIWCASLHFQAWIAGHPRFAEAYLESPEGADAEEAAAHVVRTLCNVTSRAELDHSSTSAELFHEAFRIPYNAYLNAKEPT